MTPRPKIRLSRLRDIGWTVWDPIGLLGTDQNWQDADCQPFADEYDSYLRHAAEQLRLGTPGETVAAYLFEVETQHMGLGPSPDAARRASQVVAAIQADKHLWTGSD